MLNLILTLLTFTLPSFAQVPSIFGMVRPQGPMNVQMNSAWGNAWDPGDYQATTFPQNVAAGNLLIACVGDHNMSCPLTVSDSHSQSWTKFFDWTSGISGVGSFKCYYAANAASGATTVRATTSCGSNYLVLSIYEISGIATSSPLDSAAVATGGSGNYSVNVSAPSPVAQSNSYVFLYAQDWNKFQTWSTSTDYNITYGVDFSFGKYIGFAGERTGKFGLSGTPTATVVRSNTSDGPTQTWGTGLAVFKSR